MLCERYTVKNKKKILPYFCANKEKFEVTSIIIALPVDVLCFILGFELSSSEGGM